MDKEGLVNIYEQYYINGMKYGFYLRESTWKSIGKVMFIQGVEEGQPLQGRPPYFNNPIVYVRLYYANTTGEISESTRSRVIKIYDGGTFRYQPVDENFVRSPEKKHEYTLKKWVLE